ncbi:MAG: ribokinase [Anaerolineae bacterium]|nr:ribokinase [Anaerolineae bacterium]
MGRIIILGSINMDVVVMTPRHPHPGETIFGSDLKFIPGGKGSNQAVAASRLGGDVVLVGKLGKDAFGSALQKFLEEENLNLDHLYFSQDSPSGTALISVDESAENRIIVVSGSNAELSPADFGLLSITADDILVSVFEIPQETIKAAFQTAKEVGAKTILNPAPAAPFIEGVQDLCDTLIVNETELSFFSGEDANPDVLESLHRQARAIRSRASQTIIVTLGGNGAVCLQGDDFFSVAGNKVEAVDTTAAGDCFTGALAVALKEGLSLSDAIQFANIAASLSVQKVGASASLPYRQAVDRLL